MYTRPDPPQQWSVHAEFTITHPGVNDPENAPQTHTEPIDNGVRMVYSWTAQEPHQTQPQQSEETTKSTTYQKGNLFFTSTPPKRPPDSGYGSDLLSPNSFTSGSLPRRVIQPYNRKCRSTCNIVLSTTNSSENQPKPQVSSALRTQSLRCQTPTVRCANKDNFYGCGDPWCHHLHYNDEYSRISPVPETSEDCSTPKRPSRTNTFHSTSDRKDASVQTFEMIDKSTSPYMKMDNFPFTSLKEEEKPKDKQVRRRYSGPRRRTEPNRRSSGTSSLTPDSLDGLVPPRKLVRSPQLTRITSGSELTKKDNSDSKSSENSKKPRTVHIDVYCTGTEIDSDSNSSSETNETASTPQTVFESNKVRITHQRANDKGKVPFTLREDDSSKSKLGILGVSSTGTSQEKEDSDDQDDGASTSYPSKLSSYSTIKDFSSSISSVPQSWGTYSMSSCTVPEDYDSVANTSWKDTFSDIESLQSRSSLAQTDSLDFVPRRLHKTASIDESPEFGGDLLTPSQSSIQPSDSFEYANSEDRSRIKKMEEMWKDKNEISPKSSPWRSPMSERKLLLQQKKMQEYIAKRLNERSESKASESESSDDDEKGWTFVKPEVKPIEPELSETTKQRLSLDPNLRSPFTLVPGFYTEPRFIARKFGQILNLVRKPGHHIGPAKNPDCTCDHCQRYYDGIGRLRGRTRSVGDSPTRQIINWKEYVRPVLEEEPPRTINPDK